MGQQSQLKSSLFLLIAAFIWGFAFVAQRQGMEHTGPFTFNAVRFVLGAISLIPLIWIMDRKSGQTKQQIRTSFRSASVYGLCTGLILFAGASLQQIGLLYTTAGKAAFVTGLYIVIVPFIGLFLKQRLSLNSGIGAVLAVIGLYLLCMTDNMTLGKGDLYELIGALFWSAHILMIDRFSRRTDVLKLSLVQIVTCSLLSFIVAFSTEKIELSGLYDAIIPLLYGGICSVGIAYTLQIVGQKNAHPTQAAIILSLETVFAAIGGFLLLDEVLGVRGGFGCLFMLVGMIVPQLPPLWRARGKGIV
ncbi:Permease of the drug/metabolite transporter (DMT) superfamily [Paenibacillus catalpae]|uniref:Permease of the drug/metabolite transporter (DMT) superfamily n=1 Tax=Paenibacillus catalpae TaxID=1045775 RepID=A0A1I2DGH8_9BACL|nr:DMT family transporter [Paenibacillus catalpae]SFE79624.1 Permease of the drug/metabolite transporter (DMT) superfamily [Paenibacillus catalpae]